MHRIARTAGVALAVAALAAPNAFADQTDLRGPDAIDAANAAERGQDFRSPDAIDAAAGRGTASAPEVTVIRIPPSAHPGDGVDWTGVGIGAAGGLGLSLAVAAGGIALVGRRRHATVR